MPKQKVKKVDENTKKNASFPTLTQKNFLQMIELEPEQIYVIPKFLNGKECDSLISYFETHLPPKASAGGKPKRGMAFRNNDRQSIEDASLAAILWKGMQEVVQESLTRSKGLNSNIRVYRYRKGHSFGAHYDESVQDKATGLWTDWTLLIYLNEDMKGGETVFYRDRKAEPIIVQPKKGMALLHRHGTHCMLHEAKEVQSGNKWVLRSDVLVA
jgi:predicted 2-oxoglutarate/Fe(II)-dependent dioxygenase YbiX